MALTQTAWRVTKRVLIEFGPPVIFAALWTWANSSQSSGWLDVFKNMGAAYFIISYPYLQLLRIAYQDSQKHAFKDLKARMDAAQGTLALQDTKISELYQMTKDLPAGFRSAVQDLAKTSTTVNTQIAEANSAIDRISDARAGWPSGWGSPPPPRPVIPAELHTSSLVPGGVFMSAAEREEALRRRLREVSGQVEQPRRNDPNPDHP